MDKKIKIKELDEILAEAEATEELEKLVGDTNVTPDEKKEETPEVKEEDVIETLDKAEDVEPVENTDAVEEKAPEDIHEELEPEEADEPKEETPDIDTEDVIETLEKEDDIEPIENIDAVEDVEPEDTKKLEEAIKSLNSFIISLREEETPDIDTEDVKADELKDLIASKGDKKRISELKRSMKLDIRDAAKANRISLAEDVEPVENTDAVEEKAPEDIHEELEPEEADEPKEETPDIDTEDVIETLDKDEDLEPVENTDAVEEKKPENKEYEVPDTLEGIVKLDSEELKEHRELIAKTLTIYLSEANGDLLYEEYARLLSETQALKAKIEKKYSIIAENRLNTIISGQALHEETKAKRSLFKKLNEQKEINLAKETAKSLSVDEIASTK